MGVEGGALVLEREGEGGLLGGVGRVSLGGALTLPHSHHGRHQILLSLLSALKVFILIVYSLF